LCNGMDDSLQKIDISPFKYGTVSAYDVKPIPKKKMSYLYNREGSDGKITNEPRETITVDTLFDFFHHLFAPLSTANRLYFDYAVEEREDGTWYSDYQEFRYFLVESECDWDDEEQCLIDAIRLFKTSRAGFGIAVLPEGGIGVNDLSPYSLWTITKRKSSRRSTKSSVGGIRDSISSTTGRSRAARTTLRRRCSTSSEAFTDATT